jgi:hypothetical protein
MKFLIPGLCALALCAFAQDEPAIEKNMKAVAEHSGAIRKLTSKASPEAATHAEQLAALYDEMKAFWSKRNFSDAVGWAEDGKKASLSLAAAAKAGDATQADASFGTINGTCRSCHTAHREKNAEGKYIIK